MKKISLTPLFFKFSKINTYMNNEIIIYVKLIGTILTALGSILLAWRIKVIVHWVSLALNAHEISIDVLMRAMNGQSQQFPLVSGSVKHLNDIENKLGVKLLVLGFGCLGLGMVFNALSVGAGLF